MSIVENNTPAEQPQQQSSEKEFNFRRLEQQMQEERRQRMELESQLEKMKESARHEEEEVDPEPYVDHKRLKKELGQFAAKSKQDVQADIQKAVQDALEKEREQQWIKAHPDFYDVMQHAQAFADRNPELAEDYIGLRETDFKKQKMVYNNIKATGIHKKEEPKSSIQSEINANRKGLYYTPSGVGSAPYASQGDFSDSGQKTAYAKMQELKNRLRLG